MTPRVNRDRFSVLRASEFPEGDVAVRLDGGSHFYERESVKIAISRNFHDV